MAEVHPIRLFADDAAVRRVAAGLLARTLPRPEWTHEAHLAACTCLVLEYPDFAPERELPDLIRRYNESVGGVNDDTQGYHETITQAYIRVVRAHCAGFGEGSLAECVNALLTSERGDRAWLLRFYSRARLFSLEARRTFVAPDLMPLDAPISCAVSERRSVSQRRSPSA
jgi:hypothetical protein